MRATCLALFVATVSSAPAMAGPACKSASDCALLDGCCGPVPVAKNSKEYEQRPQAKPDCSVARCAVVACKQFVPVCKDGQCQAQCKDAQTCFDRAFFAVRAQDRFVTCPRGKTDCDKNPDNGLTFTSDCWVKTSYGDLVVQLRYLAKPGEVEILEIPWQTGGTYRLSKDGRTLTSVEHPEKVYRAKP